jgi:hypothetical protein
MTFTTFTSNTKAKASEVNENNLEAYRMIGLNTIKGLIDRSGVWSAGMIDGWGDAYIDSTGRENSVNTGNTTSVWNVNKYRSLISDSTIYTSITGSTPTRTTDFTVNGIHILKKGYVSGIGVRCSGSGPSIWRITLTSAEQGQLFTTDTTEGSPGNARYITKTLDDYPLPLSAGDVISIKICRVGGTGEIPIIATSATNDGFSFTERQVPGNITWLYFTSIKGDTTETIITHDIPTGTFNNTINTSIGVPLIEEWESGADIKYKLTGTSGTEDTGWLDYNKLSTFTPFTAEPDTLIVKLIPKTTNPSPEYPSIRGFWIRTT